MSIKKFTQISENNSVNEHISDIFNREYTYSDIVKSRLVDIIMSVNGVSEKSFKRVDEIIKNVKELFQNNDEVKKIVEECEKDGDRKELCAEIIYKKIINKK